MTSETNTHTIEQALNLQSKMTKELNIADIKSCIQEIKNSKSKLIYVAWASASGKSYFAKKLAEQLRKQKKKVLEISSDDYYSNETNLQFMLYGTFDHPALIDYDLLQKNLNQYFKTGKTQLPKYSFVERRRIAYEEITKKYDYIIAEGLYTISQLSNKNNPFKIYVYSDTEELIFRRIVRDQTRVKESTDAIISMIGKVFPMRKLFGATQVEKSDLNIYNDYQIMSKDGKEYIFQELKKKPAKLGKAIKTEYIYDYIYNDQNNENGVIYVSEVYEKKWGLIDHVIVTQSKKEDYKEESYKRIVIKLYRPWSLTMMHTLLQNAGLDLIGTNKKIEYTYQDTKWKITKLKKSRNKWYLVK